MKIIGIESSSLVASVAILEGDKIIAEYTLNYKKTHSQTLLPMLDEIVKMTDTVLEEIDAIALSAGPGSFTGLRIGAATAKGLGMALNKPLIAISSLEATAYNVFRTKALICPIMDARREQVYNAVFRNADSWERVREDSASDIRELLRELEGYEEEVIFLGDGVPVYKDVIRAEAKFSYTFAPAHLSRQRAASLATLGAQYYQEERFVHPDLMTPIYLRKSQAEREKEEKTKRGNPENTCG